MKKRLPAFFFLTVGSLLLTGCEVPDKVERYWRQSWFLDVPPELAQKYLASVLIILATAAFVMSLVELGVAVRRGRPVSSRFFISFTQMFLVVAFGLLFIDSTTKVGNIILPPDLSLGAILNGLHIELSPNIWKIAALAWAVNLNFSIPLIVSRAQLLMLVLGIIVLSGSILGRSVKGIAFVIGQWVGFVLFLGLFNAIVQFFTQYYPDSWDYGAVPIIVNLFYTGTVLTAMAFCFLSIPLMAAILTPELRDEEEARKVTKEARPVADWDQVFAPWERSRQVSRDGGSREVVVPESNPSTPLLLTAGSSSSGSERDVPSGPAGDSGFTSSGPTDVPSGDVVIPPSPGENGPNQSSPTSSLSKPQEEASKAKAAVGKVATAVNLVTAVAAPEAAPIVIPVVNATTQVAEGLIDRKAAKDSGQDPEGVYPKEKVVGGILQVAGKAKGSPTLTGLGGKISSLSDDILIP